MALYMYRYITISKGIYSPPSVVMQFKVKSLRCTQIQRHTRSTRYTYQANANVTIIHNTSASVTYHFMCRAFVDRVVLSYIILHKGSANPRQYGLSISLTK